MNYLSLGELSGLIKSAILSSLNEEYWVTAEIAQINCHHHSGHCYLELVEKRDDVTTARMRATVWATNFRQISSNFEAMTSENLRTGMKILMAVRITYHEVHGLALNVRDIDPRYTIGETALKRREIIERLSREGIIENNRQLALPPVIQRIAVISSVTAAGYGDFRSRLNENPHGYRFSHRLFQAYLQGEKAEESMLRALEKCLHAKERFDAVVIIRGGGSALDLQSFDGYPLARKIALSPVPVFTGIGHERDETVADRVANMRLITPTAVAEFFIARAKRFEDDLDDLRQRLIAKVFNLAEREGHRLRNLSDGIARHALLYLKTAAMGLRGRTLVLHSRALAALKTPAVDLKEYEGRLSGAGEGMIRSNYQKIKDFERLAKMHPGHILSLQSQKLGHYETKINLLDPRNVLERGYSLTYIRGRLVKDARSVARDDIIHTRLRNGHIVSVVESAGEDSSSE